MTIKNIFTKIHGHCASHPFGTPIRSRPRFASSWVFALTKIFTNERHRGGGLVRVVDKLLKSFLRGGLGRAIWGVDNFCFFAPKK